MLTWLGNMDYLEHFFIFKQIVPVSLNTRMLESLVSSLRYWILASENEEISSFLAIVFLFKLKNPIAIQAQLPVIYVPVLKKLTCKVLL